MSETLTLYGIELPNDWDSKPLGELYSVKSRSGLYKPSQFYGAGFPMIHMPQMFGDRVVDGKNASKVRLNGSELKRFALEDGDLLFARRSLTLEGAGQCSLVTNLREPTTFESSIIRVRLDQSQAFPPYVNAYLGSEFGFRSRFRLIRQVAVSGVSSEDISSIAVPLPPLPQQRKIARILTTVDNLIEKTEALIAKYQAMKQGMMHDLFTRGVDEQGHLRPPYEEAPELYKESELGWIPKEWEVVSLHDEIEIIHGFAFQGEFFADIPPGEILLVPGNFHRDGGLYFTADNTKYYRGTFPSHTVLCNGDLVIVMTDLSPRTLILGRVCEINLAFVVLHNQRIGLIRVKRETSWNRPFLSFALNNDRLRRQIILTATGTTVRHTSPSRILANCVLKPSLHEQLEITNRLALVEKEMQIEHTLLKKLGSIKTGLMQDLLTGKVRVKVDEEAEEIVHA